MVTIEEIEKNIYFGDCLEIMKEIKDKSIDMILCDLPYGTTQCKWDIIIPFDLLWKQYKRIIKNNGTIVLFGKEPFTSLLITSNIKAYKHKWIWNKKQSGSAMAVAKYMPIPIDEDIVVFGFNRINYYPLMKKGKMRKRGGYKSTPKHMIKTGFKIGYETCSDEYYPTNILNQFSNAKRTGRIHPTEKPVLLCEYLIKTYTKKGEMVLDNCAGSGTTGIACLKLNRDFILIEKERKYFDLLSKRLKEHIKNSLDNYL